MKRILKKMYLMGIKTELMNKRFIKDKNIFLNSEMRNIKINEYLKRKLAYEDVDIYTDGKIYIFRKDGFTVFQGHIDSEGVQATIENDIDTIPDYINLIMAIVIDDKQKLNQFIDQSGLLLETLLQAKSGMEKGKMNNHY